MNESPAGRITQPLRDLACNAPDERFPLVIRVNASRANAGEPGLDVAAILREVAAGVAALDRSADERVTWSGEQAGSPFLYATLSGANVVALDARLAPNLPLEFRRDRTASDTNVTFDPEDLVGRVIAEPLASAIRNQPDETYDCIIVLNAMHAEGTLIARSTISGYFEELSRRSGRTIASRTNDNASHPYVFAALTGAEIRALVDLDRSSGGSSRTIHQIWEDSRVRSLITKTIATVKADAAHVAYGAAGTGILWAVLDSGIDVAHPHFHTNANLALESARPVRHRDFSGVMAPSADVRNDDPGAIVDAFGHGTHVAGIIAGSWSAPEAAGAARPVALRSTRNGAGADERILESPPVITGMAPNCKLVSMRVLDNRGTGLVSWIIDAFEEIQQLNGYGRRIVIAGVNLSVGYPFDAKWFGCGQSPLCVEVNRLVRSGVVVVTAAGNSGYGTFNTAYTQGWSATLPQTINDPGNADLAITVGSTHRDEPHLYGISYFSSKGPTGDGRLKPDLVAPGERIISCASAQSRLPATISQADGSTVTVAADGYTYREDSGTSMAAPHVSGVIAGFLSIRREYIGQPEDVKALFVSSATDLKRDRAFQGAGLVDIMRAIGAV